MYSTLSTVDIHVKLYVIYINIPITLYLPGNTKLQV